MTAVGFFSGEAPRFFTKPRRINWQNKVPQAAFEQVAAKNVFSPQALSPLQSTIVPTKPVTGSIAWSSLLDLEILKIVSHNL